MQALFIGWAGGVIVSADVLTTYGVKTEAEMRQLWDDGNGDADRCTIYLVKDGNLSQIGEGRL